MPGKPKYKAKYVFWDSKNEVVKSEHDINIYRCQGKLKLPEHIWRFDSQHEFKVYLQLVRMYGVSRIIRQFKLSIIPPGTCYPKGKSWRVDFAITSVTPLGGYSHYIEAKGAFLPEFGTTLACLEANNKMAFDRTLVIFSQKPSAKNRVIKALMDSPFQESLLSLQDLEKLSKLP